MLKKKIVSLIMALALVLSLGIGVTQGLAVNADAADLDPANLADGTYTVDVSMRNTQNPHNQTSMSDAAVVKPITITVKDGNYTATVNFQGISIKLGTTSFFGYLKYLRYLDASGNFTDVQYDSYYTDVIDDYNRSEDGSASFYYPHQMSFPLIHKSAGDDSDGYVHMQVFVPIMDSISSGSGTQQAFMQINWSTLQDATPAPTATPTPAPTATPTPTATPEPTATPAPTETPEPTASPEPTATPAPTAAPQPTVTPSADVQNLYRMYNPNSGEHFYTTAYSERVHLERVGWNYEGIGWTAPKTSNTPVYRLYNPNAGDHHYTTDATERAHLISVGWRDEGIGWYAEDGNTGVAVYRQYNPNAKAGAHNFTKSTAERDHLVSVGWHDEGIAWYAAG